MFFNPDHILVTNPNTETLEKKLKRVRLDIEYMNGLVDEDLLDAEEGENEDEVNEALVGLEAQEALLSAEFEAINAIKHYFFVKEAVESNEAFASGEEVVWADGTAEAADDIPEPDACDCVDECIFSAEDMQVLTGTVKQDTQGKPHSRLYEHAERELALRGDDKEFTDMFLGMIDCFSNYGHSGSSAEHSVITIERLLRWQNLTELTNDPDEWTLVNPGSKLVDLLWQNKRNPKAFTTDPEFYTYYLNGDRNTLIPTERFDFSYGG